MTWVTYSLALVIFYAIHSIMASTKMKSIFKKLGFSDQSYRILFNFMAIATTAIIFNIYRNTSGSIFEQGFAIGYGIVLIGLVLVGYALIGYDMLAFIGINKEDATEELNTSGLNAHVRHPLYLGVITGLLGWFIASPSYAALSTFIITTAYVPIGIHFEEKKLIATYGKAYEDYRKVIPMLWPKFSK